MSKKSNGKKDLDDVPYKVFSDGSTVHREHSSVSEYRKEQRAKTKKKNYVRPRLSYVELFLIRDALAAYKKQISTTDPDSRVLQVIDRLQPKINRNWGNLME